MHAHSTFLNFVLRDVLSKVVGAFSLSIYREVASTYLACVYINSSPISLVRCQMDLSTPQKVIPNNSQVAQPHIWCKSSNSTSQCTNLNNSK